MPHWPLLPQTFSMHVEASVQAQLGHFGFDISADYNKSVLGHIINYANYAFPSTYGITNQCAPGQIPNASNTNWPSSTSASAIRWRRYFARSM